MNDFKSRPVMVEWLNSKPVREVLARPVKINRDYSDTPPGFWPMAGAGEKPKAKRYRRRR